MAQQPEIALALSKLAVKKATVQRVLATADGKEFLHILKQEFFHKRLAGKSPEEMAFNLGACDVIAYIEQLSEG